jgi:hypothetical protein
MNQAAQYAHNNFGEISWLAQASTDSKQKGLFAVQRKALAAAAR